MPLSLALLPQVLALHLQSFLWLCRGFLFSPSPGLLRRLCRGCHLRHLSLLPSFCLWLVCVSLAPAPFLVDFLTAGSSSGVGYSSPAGPLTRVLRSPWTVGAATVSIVAADSSAGDCSGRGSSRASCSVIGRSIAGFSTTGSSARGFSAMDRPVAARRLTHTNLASATASCVVHRFIFAGFRKSSGSSTCAFLFRPCIVGTASATSVFISPRSPVVNHRWAQLPHLDSAARYFPQGMEPPVRAQKLPRRFSPYPFLLVLKPLSSPLLLSHP